MLTRVLRVVLLAVVGVLGVQGVADASCTLTPLVPTYDGATWTAHFDVSCSVASRINYSSWMFIGENPSVQLVEGSGSTPIHRNVAIGGGPHYYISDAGGVPCFAGGFHWWGTRIQWESKNEGAANYTYHGYTPDGPGSYGQCAL